MLHTLADHWPMAAWVLALVSAPFVWGWRQARRIDRHDVDIAEHAKRLDVVDARCAAHRTEIREQFQHVQSSLMELTQQISALTGEVTALLSFMRGAPGRDSR